MVEEAPRQPPIQKFVVHAMVMVLYLIKLLDIKEYVLHVVIHVQRAEVLVWLRITMAMLGTVFIVAELDAIRTTTVMAPMLVLGPVPPDL